MQNNIVLIPIYNDWNSLNILLKKIIDFKIFKKKTTIIIVNDFSKEKIRIKKFLFNKILNIKIINLKKNIGSQRCIAVGLSYIQRNYLNSNVIIMDGDGEDNPLLIKKLLNFSREKQNKIYYDGSRTILVRRWYSGDTVRSICFCENKST